MESSLALLLHLVNSWNGTWQINQHIFQAYQRTPQKLRNVTGTIEIRVKPGKVRRETLWTSFLENAKDLKVNEISWR